MIKRFGLICGIVILAMCFIYGERSPIQYSKVQIPITSPEDVKRLQIAGLGRDHFKIIEETMVAILDDQQIEILKTTGTSYEILIDDVIEHYNQFIRIPDAAIPQLQREMRAEYEVEGFEFGSMGGYYTFSEVVTELDSMRLLYPDLITVKQSIGSSINNVDIWMVKISDNPDADEDEPEILYTSLIHAREPQGMATVMYFMYNLLENYGTDPFVTFLVNNRELYFVPVVNPDGYLYNEQTNPNGGGMWRKNDRHNADGTWGVDLNRNFVYMWGYDDLGSSPNPWSNNYRGTAPFSEPESQVIRDLCIDRNFQLAFMWHTYTRIIYPPWGYVTELTSDSLIFQNLMINMTQYNGYEWWNGEPGGVVNGDAVDWMYGEQNDKNKILAMTYEVGGGSFWPSQSQIYPLADALVYPNLVLALGPDVLDSDTTMQVEYASISNGYLTPGIDTLIVQTGVTNPGSLPVSMQAFIESFDQTIIDSIPMFDDGSHHDSAASDGIFGGMQLVPIDEKHYSAHIYAYSDSGYSHFLNDIGLFTTVGPIAIDTVSTPYNENPPTPDSDIYFQITLRNEGSTATAPDVSIEITTDMDSLITLIAGSALGFGDIPAQDMLTTTSFYSVHLNENIPVESDITFNLAIASGDYYFWSDSFTVYVYPLGIAGEEGVLPDKFALHQNYPNPFNPLTTIQYDLPERSDVQITIYDLLGKEVTTLLSETQDAGYKSVQWEATNVASGMYFYQIRAGDYVQTQKMILLK